MSNDEVVYLHGDLDLKIVEARRLPNMDLLSEHVRRCVSALTSCQQPFSPRKQLRHGHRKIITSDPYVTVCVGSATVARTRVISNSQNPVWNQRFRIPLAHPVNRIEFTVKDDDVFGADLIGVASVPVERIVSGQTFSEWVPVVGSNGKPPKPDCALLVEMVFVTCEDNPLFRYGIAANPQKSGVPNCYFPVRQGGSMTLYQDAHVNETMMPEIELDDGKIFKHEQCWEDICHAILEAHHLVYIIGWSIYHKVRLVREPTKPLPSGGNLTLGDLLKYKSQEGVRVLMLVWDDKTSHDKCFIKTIRSLNSDDIANDMLRRYLEHLECIILSFSGLVNQIEVNVIVQGVYFWLQAGLMQTHDEETRKFFKHSSVNCVLSPRYPSSKLSIFRQKVVGTLFTHHQKCVIVDTQASGNNRKITAFLGGLDLCDGRYDTPEHRLFRDLDTIFKDDYHNPAVSAAKKAPRQPWHDLHCRIEGPAAYDVLTNFEQRWRKATKWSEFGQRFKRISHWHDDSLIKLERISWILSPSQSVPNDDPKLWVSEEDDPENWHAQVFRSIDSGSVKGFPKNIFEAEAKNLVSAKNLVIDKSIQTAYIQAIRSAQHFIYIENQYFIGSSYAWTGSKDEGAHNPIPMELALKIASKIRAKKRFAVYIVIPMWPEGVADSASVQEILFWQGQTMQMMYEIIAKELKSMNIVDSKPQDYLNFYCLGNRDNIPREELDSMNFSAHSGESMSNSRRFQRFMIYVHAKGMIIDDEYVLLGSANINQRSMAGSRDTEIAIGAYQPKYTWGSKGKHPRGQVFGYRMSLWAEHLGKLESLFQEPESLDCVRTVNSIAEENWQRYVAEDFKPLQGHILKYPVEVDENGRLSPLSGHETFPDVGGKVLGTRSNTLPSALTT